MGWVFTNGKMVETIKDNIKMTRKMDLASTLGLTKGIILDGG